MIKYTILYLVSGLAGNLLSMMDEIKTGEYAVSGGASGAIYGIIGAMLWVVIINKGRVKNITSQGLLVMIGLSLYYGFTSTGVDNLAHVGGLASGFLLSIIMCRKSNIESGSFSNS